MPVSNTLLSSNPPPSQVRSYDGTEGKGSTLTEADKWQLNLFLTGFLITNHSFTNVDWGGRSQSRLGNLYNTYIQL